MAHSGRADQRAPWQLSGVKRPRPPFVGKRIDPLGARQIVRKMQVDGVPGVGEPPWPQAMVLGSMLKSAFVGLTKPKRRKSAPLSLIWPAIGL